MCENCKVRITTSNGLRKNGTRKYKNLCYICSSSGRKKFPYKKYIKDRCEFCGFIPVHVCQLDVDHKDGNKENNDISNLQTLCSNCHRLKTYLSQDWQHNTAPIEPPSRLRHGSLTIVN